MDLSDWMSPKSKAVWGDFSIATQRWLVVWVGKHWICGLYLSSISMLHLLSFRGTNYNNTILFVSKSRRQHYAFSPFPSVKPWKPQHCLNDQKHCWPFSIPVFYSALQPLFLCLIIQTNPCVYRASWLKHLTIVLRLYAAFGFLCSYFPCFHAARISIYLLIVQT